MGLWIAMAVLAAAAALPVLAPLWRRPRVADAAPAAAQSPVVAIYRDQLAEVERDTARGVIAEPEATAARTEIARRLIRAGGEANVADAASPASRRMAVAAIVLMPVAALGLYLFLGSPQYPSQPLSARADRPQDIAAMIAAVEHHLAVAPDDGEGWDVIAPIYLRLGRYDDAARAYGNALRLLGSAADRETRYGDALVRANGGTVTAGARAAFERAAAADASDPRPRFYLAMALAQDGKREEAIAAWTALISDAPVDASWVPIARQQLAALQAGEGAAPAAGPTAADVGAAADLTPADRQAMIEGMVASLAARLETTPGDAEGWARLVRSYMVLGRTDDARAALAKARMALVADAAGLAAVEAAAKEAGVEASASE
jgi:cytochrome c-type biogenesis protein CcmH